MDKGSKKILSGEVVSRAGEKTKAVKVTHIRQHPKYIKRYTVSDKYLAHDEQDEYEVGDEVNIRETSPHSKRKKWEIIGKVS